MSGCSKTDSTPVVVSVVRDFGMYGRCVRNNPHLDGCELVPVDNTVENKPVTVCYNAALEDVVSKGGEGRWIVFCHEDWEVRENLAEALDGLDRNFLYGAIGVQVERYGRADMMVVRGRVVQPFGKGDGMAVVQGRDRDGEVGTFDCQCLIVHSSLLSRCGLRFDEKLLFDMYVEDFCAMAAERYGIRSRILPVECVHWSRGRISANFRQSVRYVRDKYAEASGRYASIAGHLNCFGADAGKRIFKWKDDVPYKDEVLFLWNKVMEEMILCCILNYNENEKALEWYRRLSPHFDTVVLDSGSNPPCRGEGVVNLDNVFYSGLMNTAYGMLKDRGYRWLMIVTSDIEIDDRNTELLVSRMRTALTIPDLGLYQPSCRLSFRGRSHFASLCHFTGRMRSVSFQEGWFHLVCREILDAALPVNLEINRMGWGIDLALSHFARIQNRLVMVDDRVRVLHPKGTGYKRDLAKAQMKEWLATIPGYESPRHFKARRMPRL